MANFAVDTSVLVAIAKFEAEASVFELVLTGTKWLIGWPTFLELRIWLLRNPNVSGQDLITLLLAAPEIEFIDFNRNLESIAAEAYARFGKGRHAATLNYGDCMTYAVAKHFDVPLLFKGADFGKTDLKIHPASAVIA